MSISGAVRRLLPRPRLRAAAAAVAAVGGSLASASVALAHSHQPAASLPSIHSVALDEGAAAEAEDPELEAAIDRLSQAARADDATTARAVLAKHPEAAAARDFIG